MNFISIIVPVYNVEQYIERCLESICGQTFQDIEIIVVNDGSNDKSYDICKIYKEKDKRIVLIDKENGGLASARNVGLANATGKYILFVDSDDWIDKDLCKKVYKYITTKEEDTELIMFNFFRVNCDYNKKSSFVFNEGKYMNSEINKIISNLLYNKEYYIPQFAWNKLYKNEIIKKNNIIFPDKFKPGEDFIFLLEYMFNCKSIDCLSKDYLYYYRVNNNSITNSYIENLWSNQKNVYKEIISLMNKYSRQEFIKEAELQYLLRAMSVITNECYSKRKFCETKKYINDTFNDKEIKHLINKYSKLDLDIRNKILYYVIKRTNIALAYWLIKLEWIMRKIIKKI